MKNYIYKMWENFKLAILMIIDSTRGSYTKVPVDTFVSLLIMVVYLLMPIDFIPDIIPIIGYLDDFIVVALILSFTKNNLEEYSVWKDQQQNGVI